VQLEVQLRRVVQPDCHAGRMMASLLKPWITRYLDAEGKQVKKGTPGARKVKKRTAKWYGQ
jgi:hypothetical protein